MNRKLYCMCLPTRVSGNAMPMSPMSVEFDHPLYQCPGSEDSTLVHLLIQKRNSQENRHVSF